MDRRSFIGALLALPLAAHVSPQPKLTVSGGQWTAHWVPCSEPCIPISIADYTVTESVYFNYPLPGEPI